jgi:signal transduction histidine kinase
MTAQKVKETIAPTPEFLTGGGEMGQRIREYDWSITLLGPIDQWPQSLRTCIRIMLTSRQPIWIGWGQQLIKLYNDPYKAIVGGKHPWALGQPASAVWKEIWFDIGPMLKTVMEKDEGTYVESQLLIMERNGYPEETYYTFSYTPIPGDDGGTAGMICANTDDTERIISDRQLKTLTRLGKNLSDPRSDKEVVDRTITALQENPHDFPFVLFYTLSGDKVKLSASTPLEASTAVVPSEIDLNADAAVFPFREAAVSRQLQVCEGLQDKLGPLPAGAWEISPDKTFILPIASAGIKDPYGFLVVGANPYRLPDEKYKSFFSLIADQIATSFSDVHALEEERKRAEALAEIDKAKTLFFSNISHEFRTPLTLLLGPIEEVLNDPASISVDKYRMGIAHRNALRMQKLVNTLLEFSRIEAGRLEGTFRPVDICTFTRDLASTFRSAIEKAGMQLHTTCGEIKDEVYIDMDAWEMIVLNLVSNAFKYSKDGHIEVGVEQSGSEIHLTIKDTGVGIPEDQQDKIFHRFYRIGNTQGRSLEGTGIGLAMVKELVSLHKGVITVDSRVGEGSVFTVTLPVGKEHLPAGKIVESSPGKTAIRHADAFVSEALKWLSGMDNVIPQTKTSYKILLADDNADMRDYVGRLLSDHYTVITATDGEDAFEKLIRYTPHLLLSDVMMPRLDGFSLLKKIRQYPSIKNIPVILLSARAGEEAKVEGLDAGADDYLIKPFSARELLARVDASIKIAQARLAVELQLRKHAVLLEEEVKNRTLELSQLNLSLQRSNEDLQQFAHVASHDLKEPIRKIRTFGSRLQDEYGHLLPDKARSFLDKIHNATERMFSMIDGVLAYSMHNSSDQPIGPVDLNEIFRNIESDLEILIAQKKGVIRKGRLPSFEGSPVLIYQLFYNLLNNALKFSKPDTPALIHVSGLITGRADEQMVEIGIADNGIGFDQQYASVIFDTFARLNSKDKYEGTGLGLALCKRIVMRHHGTITAIGAKDKGAVFTVSFPMKQTSDNL